MNRQPGKGAASLGFDHVVFKRLSAVEADRSRSNQHEFNGSAPLRSVFGTAARRIPAGFVRMADDGTWISASGDLTWYDARAMHPTRTEYRLYYRNNAVTARTAEGDILLLALRSDDSALALVAPGSGLAAARIFWLFGIEIVPGAGFAALDLDHGAQQAIAMRLGLALREAAGGWSSDDPVRIPQGDATLRDATSRSQRLVGTVTTHRTGHGEDDWFPEDVPPGLGGDAMGQTIRGIVGRRTGH